MESEMKRLLSVFTATILSVASVALAQNAPMTVKLDEQNKSGESGTATITPQGSKTQIVLDIKGAPDAAQPAHIHAGSCASLDPKPKIPLQNDSRSSGAALNWSESADPLERRVSPADRTRPVPPARARLPVSHRPTASCDHSAPTR